MCTVYLRRFRGFGLNDVNQGQVRGLGIYDQFQYKRLQYSLEEQVGIKVYLGNYINTNKSLVEQL